MDAQDEADGVEDVGFAGAVEAGDGVEVRVESKREREEEVRNRQQILNYCPS